jgi:hypothetical protein
VEVDGHRFEVLAEDLKKRCREQPVNHGRASGSPG